VHHRNRQQRHRDQDEHQDEERGYGGSRRRALQARSDPPVHRVEHHNQHRCPQQNVHERLEHEPAQVQGRGERDAEGDQTSHAPNFARIVPRALRQVDAQPYPRGSTAGFHTGRSAPAS
jgi:hypothetical protein